MREPEKEIANKEVRKKENSSSIKRKKRRKQMK